VTTSCAVLALDEAARAAARGGFGVQATPPPAAGRRGRVYVRRDLGIGSFGVNAFYGGCTFSVDGEVVDAPQGTAVYVGDPAATRSARATADDTIVLVVGGRPGEAFRPGPGEALAAFNRLYRAGDHEGALAACRAALAEHPGNALMLCNVACTESRLGRPEAALEPLRDALAAWPAYRELAAAEDDLAALRDDARFQELIR
jgi:hypothetical protein